MTQYVDRLAEPRMRREIDRRDARRQWQSDPRREQVVKDDRWVERARYMLDADIRRYEGILGRMAAMRADGNRVGHERGIHGLGDMYDSMTHRPEAPTRPVTMEFAGTPRTLGQAHYKAAGPLSTLAETGRNVATIPLYMNPATAGPMAAFDLVEGAMSGDPLTLAMAAAGGGRKIARLGTAALGMTADRSASHEGAEGLSQTENDAVLDYAKVLDNGGPWTTGGRFAEGGMVDPIDEAEELGRIAAQIARWHKGPDGPEFTQLPEAPWPAGMPTVNRSLGGDDGKDGPGTDPGTVGPDAGTGNQAPGDATGPGTGTEGGDGGGTSGPGGDPGGPSGPSGNESDASGPGDKGGQDVGTGNEAPGEQTGLGAAATAADAAVGAAAPASDPESAVANNMNAPGPTSEIGFDPFGLMGDVVGIGRAQAAAAPENLGVKDTTDRAPTADVLGSTAALGLARDALAERAALDSVRDQAAPHMGPLGTGAVYGGGLGLGLGPESRDAAAAIGFGQATTGPSRETAQASLETGFNAPMSGPPSGAVGVATAAQLGTTAPTAPTEQTVGHPAPPARDPMLGTPPAPNFTQHDPTEVGRFGIPGLNPGFAPTNLDTLAETRQQAALEAEQEQAQIEAMMEAQQIRDMELAQLFDPTLMGPPQNFQAPEPPAPVTAPPMGPDEFNVNLPPDMVAPTPQTETAPRSVMDMFSDAVKGIYGSITGRQQAVADHEAAMARDRAQMSLQRDERAMREQERALDREMARDRYRDYQQTLATPVDKFQDRLDPVAAAVAAAPSATAPPAVTAPTTVEQPTTTQTPAEVQETETVTAPPSINPATIAAPPAPAPARDPARDPARTAQAPEEVTSPLTFSVSPRSVAPPVPETPYGPAVTELPPNRLNDAMKSVFRSAATGIPSAITGIPFGLIDRTAQLVGLPNLGMVFDKMVPAQTPAPYGNNEGQGPYGAISGQIGSYGLPGGQIAGYGSYGLPQSEPDEPMDYDPRTFQGLPDDIETYGQRAEHRYYSGGGLVRAAKRLFQEGPHPAELERMGQGVLDLGDDLGYDRMHADRLRRGASLGYTQPAFHGSNHPIERFRKGFLPLSHFGTPEAAADRLSAKRGFSPEDDEISEYVLAYEADKLGLPGANKGWNNWTDDEAEFFKRRVMTEQPWIGRGSPTGEPTEHVLPLMLNRGRSLEIRDNGLMSPIEHAKAVQEALTEIDGGKLYGGNTGWDENAFRGRPDAAAQMLANRLNQMGIDSLHYKNQGEDIGSTSYVVTRPNQVRSVFAKFDPNKVKSGDIMASAAPVAAGGALAGLAMNDENGGEEMGPLARYARGGQVKGYAMGGLTGIQDIRPLAFSGGLSSGGAENLSYAPTNPTPTNPIPAPANQPGTSFNPAPPVQPDPPPQTPVSYGGTNGQPIPTFGGGNVWTPWGLKPSAMFPGGALGMGGGFVGGQAPAPRAYIPPTDPFTYGQRPQQTMWR